MDRRGVWAFTPATFSALLGDPEPNYLKVRLENVFLSVRPMVLSLTRSTITIGLYAYNIDVSRFVLWMFCRCRWGTSWNLNEFRTPLRSR
jgi:hypothetical protein